ncbi:DMT family transporter [Microvirga arsenatis]|uniref:EamA family transporter n=1 Tax=Microvirga arsenatis TaxID=2692265 RepID=A0ABW9YUF9_9HYPH|nr:DMT family transporter [Microvirga arsenatis]NBJ12944.1 EamA family transporter [Microvirga arsenatis]NBJ23926.1 EamA family transporter [Microvirga arsenatis]
MSDIARALPHSSTRPALPGWLAALATVTIWAAWAVGTRHAVTHELPPAALGLLRFGIPALLLAPIAWGMQFAPAAEIGPLLPGTMPLFVALIGWLVFGERLAGLRVFGFALILAGVACIGGHGLLFSGNGAWRGHLLLLTGAGLWGIYTHAYRRCGLSALQAAALIGLWSFLILLPFGGAPLLHALDHGLDRPVVLQALLQGFLSGVAGIILYGIAIDRLGASRAAAVSPLSIVLAALLAIPVLGEIPSAAAWIGIVLATLGVVLASGVFNRPSARAG